jgi:hypothetical protein
MWTIKGRYEHAIETDDDVTWSYENGQDVLRFLLVSFHHMIIQFMNSVHDIMYRWMIIIDVNHLSL